ncbi:alpha/beta hydrolase [Planctomycetaceae bacterium]|jgi:pimeloyl-ACP methyl ester carboxylesterase|nr:alpha/beta hydrolase [Planctomycetaceae bacterium]MDC0261611.1 alpha/beta hydrolase [Planctomycetaceae bacterium]
MTPNSPPEPVERTVNVDGHEIAIVDGTAGRTGPPVVFVHGILMSVHLWPMLLRGTSLDRYRWISVGLPGHSPSVAPENFSADDVTEKLFSASLMTAIDQCFEGESVHLVGWSTGGYAVLMTAAEYPQRVKSVVSLSGFVRGQWGHLLGYFQFVSQIWWRGWAVPLGMKLVACSPHLYRAFRWLMTIKAIPKTELMREVTEMSYADYRQNDFQVMRNLFSGLKNIDSSVRLSEIKAPVLVLSGERDKVIIPAETKHISELLANTKLVEQAGVGHLFYSEGREQTLLQIDEWISQYG